MAKGRSCTQAHTQTRAHTYAVQTHHPRALRFDSTPSMRTVRPTGRHESRRSRAQPPARRIPAASTVHGSIRPASRHCHSGGSTARLRAHCRSTRSPIRSPTSVRSPARPPRSARAADGGAALAPSLTRPRAHREASAARAPMVGLSCLRARCDLHHQQYQKSYLRCLNVR